METMIQHCVIRIERLVDDLATFSQWSNGTHLGWMWRFPMSEQWFVINSLFTNGKILIWTNEMVSMVKNSNYQFHGKSVVPTMGTGHWYMSSSLPLYSLPIPFGTKEMKLKGEWKNIKLKTKRRENKYIIKRRDLSWDNVTNENYIPVDAANETKMKKINGRRRTRITYNNNGYYIVF